MLQSVNELHSFTIHAHDGEIGAIQDVLWDDAHWTIRYLVVDTGKWLPGRSVLLSPAAARFVDWLERRIPVNLSCQQVKDSPNAETDQPVSRQHETDLAAYYGWPAYWTAASFNFEPLLIVPPTGGDERSALKSDPHLRSAREVRRCQIDAVGGEIGCVSDFVFDDETWRIVFLVADAGHWLHKRLLLLKPEWITEVNWHQRRIVVNLTRESLKNSPPFSPRFPIPREYAERLAKHYRRAG